MSLPHLQYVALIMLFFASFIERTKAQPVTSPTPFKSILNGPVVPWPPGSTAPDFIDDFSNFIVEFSENRTYSLSNITLPNNLTAKTWFNSGQIPNAGTGTNPSGTRRGWTQGEACWVPSSQTGRLECFRTQDFQTIYNRHLYVKGQTDGCQHYVLGQFAIAGDKLTNTDTLFMYGQTQTNKLMMMQWEEGNGNVEAQCPDDYLGEDTYYFSPSAVHVDLCGAWTPECPPDEPRRIFAFVVGFDNEANLQWLVDFRRSHTSFKTAVTVSGQKLAPLGTVGLTWQFSNNDDCIQWCIVVIFPKRNQDDPPTMLRTVVHWTYTREDGPHDFWWEDPVQIHGSHDYKIRGGPYIPRLAAFVAQTFTWFQIWYNIGNDFIVVDESRDPRKLQYTYWDWINYQPSTQCSELITIITYPRDGKPQLISTYCVFATTQGKLTYAGYTMDY